METEPIAPGRRIVDILHVAQQFAIMGQHSKKCTYGKFELVREIKSGFYSTLIHTCNMCKGEFRVTTDPAVENPDIINEAAVWGALSIGIGRSQMEELFNIMEVPVMSAEKFRRHEIEVGKVT